MGLEYWLKYQNYQIEHIMFVGGATLLAIIYYGVALWCFRRKALGKFEKWLDLRPETIATHKLGHLMFSSLLMIVGVVFCSFLLISIIALQTDINRGLSSEQVTGVVASSFNLFHGRTYVVIDGELFTYQNSLLDAPLHEGETYEITYLQHSREIFRVSQLPD